MRRESTARRRQVGGGGRPTGRAAVTAPEEPQVLDRAAGSAKQLADNQERATGAARERVREVRLEGNALARNLALIQQQRLEQLGLARSIGLANVAPERRTISAAELASRQADIATLRQRTTRGSVSGEELLARRAANDEAVERGRVAAAARASAAAEAQAAARRRRGGPSPAALPPPRPSARPPTRRRRSRSAPSGRTPRSATPSADAAVVGEGCRRRRRPAPAGPTTRSATARRAGDGSRGHRRRQLSDEEQALLSAREARRRTASCRSPAPSSARPAPTDCPPPGCVATAR